VKSRAAVDGNGLTRPGGASGVRRVYLEREDAIRYVSLTVWHSSMKPRARTQAAERPLTEPRGFTGRGKALSGEGYRLQSAHKPCKISVTGRS